MLSWLVDVEPDPAALSGAHDRWWPTLLERAGHVLPESAKEIGSRLGIPTG